MSNFGNSNPMGAVGGNNFGNNGSSFGNGNNSFGNNNLGNGGGRGGAMDGVMGQKPYPAPAGGGIPGLLMPDQIGAHRMKEALGLGNMNDAQGPMSLGQGTTIGAQTVKIRSISLGATRPQSTQFRRAYSVFADNSILNKIANGIVNSNSDDLRTNPLAMAAMLSDPATSGKGIVQYAGGTEGTVDIVNSWETMRYRFVILAEIWRAGRHTRTEIISGYTDECGVNNPALPNTRSINPAMVFTVNNVSLANIPTQYNSAGAVAGAQMAGSSGVFRNPDWVGPMAGNQLYMARPKDVAASYAKLDLATGEREYSQGAGGGAMDIDCLLAGQTQMSVNSSNLAPTYSSRLINGMLTSQLASTDPMNMDHVPGALTTSAARMNETNFTNTGFVNAILNETRNHISADASFTYADLLRLDSTVDDRCTVFTLARENNMSNLYVPDGTSACNIGESTPAGMAATMISQGLVGLMLTGGISFASLIATNYGGHTVVVPNGFDGLDSDGMLGQRMQTMCDRLKIEVFDIITMCDSGASIHCEIIADAFNDVFVSMTLDGQKQDFVFPTFASSSASPVITSNPDSLKTLAGGIRDVVEVVRMSFNSIANNDRPSFGTGVSSTDLY